MFTATTTISHPDYPTLDRDDFKKVIMGASAGDNVVDWSGLIAYWTDVIQTLDAATSFATEDSDMSFSHHVNDEHEQALRDAYEAEIVVEAKAKMEALGFVVERTFTSVPGTVEDLI